MILIFCFTNLSEVLKKCFGPSEVMMSIYLVVMADISKTPKWNLIEQLIKTPTYRKLISPCKALCLLFEIFHLTILRNQRGKQTSIE